MVKRTKTIMICFLIILMMSISSVKAADIYSLKSPKEICGGVINDSVSIYMTTLTTDPVKLNHKDNECSSKRFSDETKSYTWFGLSSYKKPFVEGVAVSADVYRQFSITNKKRVDDNDYGIKPGENFYLTFDLGNKKFNKNDYQDVRVEINYGYSSGDISIVYRNSIQYTLEASDGTIYGPYELEYASVEEVLYSYNDSDEEMKITKYKLISENVLKDVPAGKEIVKVSIAPYGKYEIPGGSFKLFDFKVAGYNSNYSVSKSAVRIDNAESLIRHNITNNMIQQGTIKWTYDPNNTADLSFFNYYASKPKVLKRSETNKYYYGLPYVNTYRSTYESFQDHMEKRNGVNFYQIPSQYTKSVTASNGDKITEGQNIEDNLYVYYPNSNKDSNTDNTRGRNLRDYPYVKNNGYVFGSDCSKATHLASATYIPSIDTTARASAYTTSLETMVLGNIDIDYANYEKDYLRAASNPKVDSNVHLTQNSYDKLYDDFIRGKNSAETIYNGYALTIPGDLVINKEHARLITGYPTVVCNDNTTIIFKNYTSGACNNHNGINPDKSYVITTELTSVSSSSNRSHDAVRENETGWSFVLDKSNTDLNTLDDLLTTDGDGNSVINADINSDYLINVKYTFSNLYEGTTSSRPLYLPIRYKSLQNIIDTGKVEIPTVKTKHLVTESELKETKELKGIITTNYLIREVKYIVNGEEYTVHPLQTNIFSLYYDTPEYIRDAIKELDSDNMKVRILIKQGPELSQLKSAAGLDSDYYGTVLSNYEDPEPTKPTEPEEPIIPPKTGALLSILFVAILICAFIFVINKQKKYNKIKRI